MYINSFQHLVLVFIVFGIGIQPSKTQHVPPEQCATGVHAILLRGQGPGDHLNVMVSLQNLILQLIPGSSSVALPYKHGDDDHRLAGANGAIMMQQYIRFYVASCPKSKIYLHGYSLSIEAGSKFPILVIAAVSYGEETFVPGQPWNVGNCVDGTGIYPRIHPETCAPFASSLQSYCDEDDSTCCLRLPPPSNLAHFLYIFRYNMDVLHFVQRRLNETQAQAL
ncbi:hypothetical protein N7462_006278 [Penicillium macrosclerotiorum]|uniref:uncharacterized protein n=1 Tax=Penicillium macrosclerotiorum TaxID=303699 RepID=UPI002547B9E1|nr:uncharacterized protein N7462_006278 [Penicillium macrosclerotiorum]KAJ5683113.1 hypothetical protein N7462_006278 [Penicillium macrosclerotiorum]